MLFSHLNSDQKLAKSRLFLARKESPGGARTPDLQFYAKY